MRSTEQKDTAVGSLELSSITLADLLSRVSKELAALAASMAELERQLADRPKSSALASHHYVQAMQNVDWNRQHLHALAGFLTELVQIMPCTCRVNSERALSDIKLSSLVERLSAPGNSQFESERADPGECDFF